MKSFKEGVNEAKQEINKAMEDLDADEPASKDTGNAASKKNENA